MAEIMSKTLPEKGKPVETRSRQQLIQYLVISCAITTGLAFEFMLWNLFRPYPLEPRENAGLFVTSMLLTRPVRSICAAAIVSCVIHRR